MNRFSEITLDRSSQNLKASEAGTSQKFFPKHSDNFQTSHTLPSEACNLQFVEDPRQTTEKYQICQTHQKEMDILCIQNCHRVCSHCILFGEYKNQAFISVPQMKEEISMKLENEKKVQNYRQQEYPSYLENERQDTLRKLIEKKQNAIKQIKRSFIKLNQLLENIETEHYKHINEEFLKIQKQLDDSFEKLVKKKSNTHIETEVIEDLDTYYIKNVVGKKTLSLEEIRLHYKQPVESIKKKYLKDSVSIEILNEDKVKKFLKDYLQVFFDDKKYVNEKESSIPKKMNQSRVSGNKSKMKVKDAGKVFSPCHRNVAYENKMKTFLNQTQSPTSKSVDTIVEMFMKDPLKDTLDLSNQHINNLQGILENIRQQRQIPRMKLNRIGLTDNQLSKILPYLHSTQCLNLSFNNLSEQSLTILLEKVPYNSKLNIINMSRNSHLTQLRKQTKEKISQLKVKLGIVIMI